MTRSMSYSRYLSTATPTAAGIASTAANGAPEASRAAVPGVSDKVTAGTSATATRHPDQASHLICCRWVAVPRRPRATSDHTASTTQPTNPPSPATAASNGTAAGATPNGLLSPGRFGRSDPGEKASPAAARTANPPASQPTGRHRGEGTRPSGNSRTRHTATSVTNGTQIHSWTQPAYAPPGKPWPAEAASPYSKVAKSTASTGPVAARIQPTRWPGRRQVSTAPTPPNPIAYSPANPRIPKNPPGTGVDQSQAISASPAAATTNVAAPSNHADLRAHRIALTPPSTPAGEPPLRPATNATLRPHRPGNVTEGAPWPLNRERHAGQASPELIQAPSDRAATQAGQQASRKRRAIRHNTLTCTVPGPGQLDRGRSYRVSAR